MKYGSAKALSFFFVRLSIFSVRACVCAAALKERPQETARASTYYEKLLVFAVYQY